MERSPSPEQPSPEHQLVDQEIRQADLSDRLINETAARIIASWWHGGQSTDLYAFQSSGAITESTKWEVIHELADPNIDPADALPLGHLVLYLAEAPGLDENGERPPVENWHEQTSDWHPPQAALFYESGYDDDNECVSCGAHISEPHDPSCPRADADLEDESETPAERLARGMEADFRGVSDAELIRRIESAHPFEPDDDASYELDRRLKLIGKSWRWDGGRVEAYEVGDGR